MARLSSSLASSASKLASTPFSLFNKAIVIRNPTPISSTLRHGFCSDPSTEPEPEPPSASAADQTPPPTSDRTTRSGSRRSPEKKMDETICHMMAQRPWTTRLQNSIRSLVPTFDPPLVLAVLRRAAHPEHALRFFRWVEKTGFRHDPHTYREIISILSRASMLNHARCILLDDVPDRGVPRDEQMFAALIDGYGRAGIPQEAVKIFRKMPELGVERSVTSYNAFFKSILKSGRVMMSKRVFNSMVRDGVQPEISTYNTLIWGFCLSIKMETATRFFADMKERGIVPDVVTYNTLINGWVRAKKLGEAENVFGEMGIAGFAPNSISYNVMIKGYVSEGNVDDGLRMFREMSAKGLTPDERTYEALLPGLCDDMGRVDDARKVLNEMAKQGITPKDKSLFLRLISCLSESGDLDGALEILRNMARFRVKVDSSHYGVLIEGLCKSGRFDKAVEILDELLEKGTLLDPQSSGLKPSAYNPIIEHLCGHGLTKKAEQFFRQLMKKGVDDMVAFNHLIRGHAKEGMPEPAFELHNIMTRRGVPSDADAYEMLVESFLKKCEPGDAKTVLDAMMEQGHLPSPSLFRSVMVALFDDGRVQTASRVMKSMIEKGVKENLDIAQKILESLFMRGHIEEALGRINMMMVNECAPDFDGLVTALCDAGKTSEVHKLADFGVERDFNISFSSYDRVLDVLGAAGETMTAYSLLCKIKAKGGAVNKKGCDALIKSLIAEGNTKQADILSRFLSGKSTKAPLDGGKRDKKFTVDAY